MSGLKNYRRTDAFGDEDNAASAIMQLVGIAHKIEIPVNAECDRVRYQLPEWLHECLITAKF